MLVAIFLAENCLVSMALMMAASGLHSQLTGYSVIKADNKQFSVSGTQTQTPLCSQWGPRGRLRSALAKMQHKHFCDILSHCYFFSQDTQVL